MPFSFSAFRIHNDLCSGKNGRLRTHPANFGVDEIQLELVESSTRDSGNCVEGLLTQELFSCRMSIVHVFIAAKKFQEIN